jgi:hypothetical protein
MEIIRLGNREQCLEEVDRLAVRNWFNQDAERIIAFSTIYGSYANRVGVSALTFRRLEQGINYFAVTQHTYAAFFHNWLLAVKFSVVLQVILFLNMIYDCVRLIRKINREMRENEENRTYSIVNQIIFIFLQFSSCIIYLLRELKMESTVATYKTNRNGSNFYGACQLSYIFVCNLSMILFILMMRTTGLLRFVNGWHNANKFISTLASKTFHLAIYLLLLMTIVAQMCLLVINSDLYSTFIGSIGGLTSQLLATSDLPTPYYPHSTLVIFGAFFLIGRIFARGISASIAKEEYRDIKMSERLHSAYRTNDYELIPFALNRIRMYLGLKKQKKIRHNVRFEGMITPLSRGS